MRKVYKTNEDQINQLIKTPESSIDFDRSWNGKYDLIIYGGSDIMDCYLDIEQKSAERLVMVMKKH